MRNQEYSLYYHKCEPYRNDCPLDHAHYMTSYNLIGLNNSFMLLSLGKGEREKKSEHSKFLDYVVQIRVWYCGKVNTHLIKLDINKREVWKESHSVFNCNFIIV